MAIFLIPLILSWIEAWPTKDHLSKLEIGENKVVVQYLKRHALANDKIDVWGRFNGIPYLAGFENGTRFLNKNLLVGSFRGPKLIAMPASHWNKYFSDLQNNKPKWFVDHSPVDMEDAPISLFPELKSYIDKNYAKVAEVEGDIVYKRTR